MRNRLKISDGIFSTLLLVDRVKNLTSVISEDPDVLDRAEADDQVKKLLNNITKNLEQISKIVDKK